MVTNKRYISTITIMNILGGKESRLNLQGEGEYAGMKYVLWGLVAQKMVYIGRGFHGLYWEVDSLGRSIIKYSKNSSFVHWVGRSSASEVSPKLCAGKTIFLWKKP